MTEEEQKKVNKETIKKLQSPNSELVANTLNQLEESGNSAYIPILIELLHSTKNSEIKKRISRLLAELKHSDAIPLIIEAIQNKQYVAELQHLVSACWENGMDYSDHLSLFTDLVIENDFLVAFEAHTVITNMTGKISEAVCQKESKKIEVALPLAEENKKQLLLEILDFLPAFEQGIEPMSI